MQLKFETTLFEKAVFLENQHLVVLQYYLSDVDYLHMQQYQIEMDFVNDFHIQDPLEL